MLLHMNAQTTVSTKYQVVIPKKVRNLLKIKPGTTLSVSVLDGSIHLVPDVPVQSLCGALKGVKTPFERDPDRPL